MEPLGHPTVAGRDEPALVRGELRPLQIGPGGLDLRIRGGDLQGGGPDRGPARRRGGLGRALGGHGQQSLAHEVLGARGVVVEERVADRAGLVQPRGAPEVLVGQRLVDREDLLLGTGDPDLRVGDARRSLRLDHRGARRLALGLGGREPRPRGRERGLLVPALQPADDLPRLDPIAFTRRELHEAAGNLGGDHRLRPLHGGRSARRPLPPRVVDPDTPEQQRREDHQQRRGSGSRAFP